jgi:hypothetical protein
MLWHYSKTLFLYVEIYDRFACGGNGKPKKMSSKTQRHGKFICSELVKGHGHGKKRTRQGSQFTTANGSQSDLAI